jgi:hypothetical protein
MLEQARTWLKSHLPDPERTGLRAWLIATQVAIVLLVGGGIAWYASGMLHALADQQGKARVQLAATTAREDLRRIGDRRARAGSRRRGCPSSRRRPGGRRKRPSA